MHWSQWVLVGLLCVVSFAGGMAAYHARRAYRLGRVAKRLLNRE